MQFLLSLISFVFTAHGNQATKPSKSVRKWDGRTPYAVHPVWCATTILTEAALPEELRIRGSQVLLLHDVLEDTTAGLPEGLSVEVIDLVNNMTFESSEQEMEMVWDRSSEVRLLKVYDKVSNLLDGSWMSKEKRDKYVAYTLRLTQDVEKDFGPLNITRIARSICQ